MSANDEGSSSRVSANGGASSSSGEDLSLPLWAVTNFKVKEDDQGHKHVELKNAGGDKRFVESLSVLPTYINLFSNGSMSSIGSDIFYDDCERIFRRLRRSNIAIEGEFNCVNRLLDLPNPDAYLRAPDGFLYFNRNNDRDTYGSVVSATASGVALPAIQVHIEERRTDRRGRTVNRLRLRKETLYIVRGLTEFVPRERNFHCEIHTFRVPRAYVDQVLMCDMYNYPKVGHLTVTRETRRGRELMSQLEFGGATCLCDGCKAKTNVLYYEDCHDDDCSINGVLSYHGPTARLVSNDVLFSRFGMVSVRAVETFRFTYDAILKATSLVARLYGNSQRDFVSEIVRISRCEAREFLKVANVSQKIRSYFSNQNTCYMLAPGPKGQLVQTKPLEVDLNIQMIATDIDGQYVDRVNLSNFSLTQTECGIYHMSPSEEPYTGPRELGQLKLGDEENFTRKTFYEE